MARLGGNLTRQGATPLGYAAAVLPGSTFDPTAFGAQVAALERQKGADQKAQAKKDLDAALKSINPELDKLKWSSPYLNEYKKKFDDYRTRNVDLYRKQGGRLTAEQISENEIWKQTQNAEIELVNTTYDDFAKLKQKVLTDPKYNTPENLKEVEKWDNIYENDPEGIKRAGGFLEYIASNPINIKPKEEPLDISAKIQDYKTAVGTSKLLGKPQVDPTTGVTIYPTTETDNLVQGLEIAKSDWANDPRLQQAYPAVDDYLRVVSQGMQGTKTTAQIRKTEKPTGTTITQVGGAQVSQDLIVSTDTKDLSVSEEVKGLTPLGKPAEKVLERTFESKGWNILDKNKKQISFSALVNNIGTITPDGVKFASDVNLGNVDLKLSSVRELPTSNADINIKMYPQSANKKALMKVAKNGVIPAGTTFDKTQIKALEALDITDPIISKKYAFGEIKNLKEIIEGRGRDAKTKIGKVYNQAVLVPYEDVKGDLSARGFDLPEGDQKYFTPQQPLVPRDEQIKLRDQGYKYERQGGKLYLVNRTTKDAKRVE